MAHCESNSSLDAIDKEMSDIMWATWAQMDTDMHEATVKANGVKEAEEVQESLNDKTTNHMQPPPSPTESTCSSLFEDDEEQTLTPEKQAFGPEQQASTTTGEHLIMELSTVMAEQEPLPNHKVTCSHETNGVPQGLQGELPAKSKRQNRKDCDWPEINWEDYFDFPLDEYIPLDPPMLTWQGTEPSHTVEVSVHEAKKPHLPVENITQQVGGYHLANETARQVEESQISQPAHHVEKTKVHESVHQVNQPTPEVQEVHRVTQSVLHVDQLGRQLCPSRRVQPLQHVEQPLQRAQQKGFLNPACDPDRSPSFASGDEVQKNVVIAPREAATYLVPEGQSVHGLAGLFGLTLPEVKSGRRNRKAPVGVRNTMLQKSQPTATRDQGRFAGVQKTKAPKSKLAPPHLNDQTPEKKARKNAAVRLAHQKANKNATPSLLEEANRQIEELAKAKAARYLNHKIDETMGAQQFPWQQAHLQQQALQQRAHQVAFQQSQQLAMSFPPVYAEPMTPYYNQQRALQASEYQHLQHIAHSFLQQHSNQVTPHQHHIQGQQVASYNSPQAAKLMPQSSMQGRQAAIPNSPQVTKISPEWALMQGQRGAAFRSPQRATPMSPFSSPIQGNKLLSYNLLPHSPAQTHHAVANNLSNQASQIAEDQSSQMVMDEFLQMGADEFLRMTVDEFSQTIADESSQMTMDQPSQMAVGKSPQMAIDQVPAMVMDKSSEMAVDQIAQMTVDQSTQLAVDSSLLDVNQSPSMAAYQPRMIVNQSPPPTTYQSPQMAVYQSPIVMNQSPLMATYQSPIGLHMSPSMATYPSPQVVAYQPPQHRHRAIAYGFPQTPFQVGAYQALQQPHQMAAYNHAQNVPQIGTYYPPQQARQIPQQRPQMQQQGYISPSQPVQRYYPPMPRQQPIAQQAPPVPQNQSHIDQLLRQQVQQSGLYWQQNLVAGNIRNSQMTVAQANAAAAAATTPVNNKDRDWEIKDFIN